MNYYKMIDDENIDILEKRMNEYDKPFCWQYQIRVNNLEEDLQAIPLAFRKFFKENYKSFTVSDFCFRPIVTEHGKEEAVNFIKRHEWLGTITQYTTHYFGCYIKEVLAGVILFSMPNSFSKLLGDDTKHLERLISRGACISWSPKCLASAFLMWCIRWMVDNTEYRLFTAYSDPMAKELGTIYQSCNFYYLGQKSGTTTRYINPYTGKIVSDRFFRTRSAYKRYAKELGIKWKSEWISGDSVIRWDIIPNEIEYALRKMSKEKQLNADKIEFPPKHKYAYVLGRTKGETKKLRKEFLSRNKTYDYPKDRGV